MCDLVTHASLCSPPEAHRWRVARPQEELLKGRDKWLNKGLLKAESPNTTPRSTPPPSPLFHFQPQHQPARRASSSSSAVSSPSRQHSEALGVEDGDHGDNHSTHSAGGDLQHNGSSSSPSNHEAGGGLEQHQHQQEHHQQPLVDDGFKLNGREEEEDQEEEEEGYDELDHDLGVLEEVDEETTWQGSYYEREAGHLPGEEAATGLWRPTSAGTAGTWQPTYVSPRNYTVAGGGTAGRGEDGSTAKGYHLSELGYTEGLAYQTGAFAYASGEVAYPDGSVQYPDGSVVYPGEVVPPTAYQNRRQNSRGYDLSVFGGVLPTFFNPLGLQNSGVGGKKKQGSKSKKDRTKSDHETMAVPPKIRSPTIAPQEVSP
jgi:hypothetical protein